MLLFGFNRKVKKIVTFGNCCLVIYLVIFLSIYVFDRYLFIYLFFLGGGVTFRILWYVMTFSCLDATTGNTYTVEPG